jgi:hypothetical protein
MSAPELWLAPTADVPTTRTKKDNPVCDGPCPTCGERVLTGRTHTGEVVIVELSRAVYCVLWHKPDEPPVMSLSGSRGYPVHRCHEGREATGEPVTEERNK